MKQVPFLDVPSQTSLGNRTIWKIGKSLDVLSCSAEGSKLFSLRAFVPPENVPSRPSMKNIKDHMISSTLSNKLLLIETKSQRKEFLKGENIHALLLFSGCAASSRLRLRAAIHFLCNDE